MASAKPTISDNPDALVAIAYGGHKQGNHRLVKMATQELLDRYGIRLSFVRESSRKAVAR